MARTTITGTTTRLDGSALVDAERIGTDDYEVVDTLEEAEAVYEATGRRIARERGVTYPIEPDTRHGKGPWGDGLTWGETPFMEMTNGKYAFLRTANLARWKAAGAQEDTDGTKPPAGR